MEFDYEDFEIMPPDKKTKWLHEDQTVENPEANDYEEDYSCYR